MRGNVMWLPYVILWRAQDCFAFWTLSQSEKQSLSARPSVMMEQHKFCQTDFREVSHVEEAHHGLGG
jgi:hypothetical protein